MLQISAWTKPPRRAINPPDMSRSEPISPLTAAIAPGLATLRMQGGEGPLADGSECAAGVVVHADPALGLAGHFTSPAGRLLELSARISGRGDWVGLHVTLDLPDLAGLGWVGLACRSAAPEDVMVRPCLRSGTQDGFADHFFAKHILSGPEAMAHLDALDLTAMPDLPRTAPWRELVLFLPRTDFTWHLHDLRVFAA